MKKLIILSILVLSLLIIGCSSNNLKDNSDKVVIYFFWNPGCPSCDVQSDFLDVLPQKYSDIEIKRYDISIKENQELLERLALAYDERILTTPVTFVADESIVGFGSAQTTGLLIEDIIIRCQSQSCMNPSDVLKAYE